MTRSGIEHDLKKSPYVVEVEYWKNHYIKYYFSSTLSKEKFIAGMDKNREHVINSLTNRFKMLFYVSPDFCDIILYSRVENRGFLINMDGGDVEWLKNLEYDGQKVVNLS